MIKKQPIKSRNATKVTFRVDFAKKAHRVELAGDFNNWQPQFMKHLKNGDFKLVVDLESGRSYQYRYRIDGRWENDWAADRYVPNDMGSENSVVDC